MTDPDMERQTVLGVRCFAGDPDLAARLVLTRARDRSGGYGCFCNVHVLSLAQHDHELRRALDHAAFVFPDGSPVAWLQRRLGASSERVAGPDLVPRVLDRGRVDMLGHYFLGSTPLVLESLQARVRARYPGVRIVGALAPPFEVRSERFWRDVIAEIEQTEPHVVWCAFGAPKQELWMHRYAHELAPSVVLGVGAAFDFLAETKPRAPLWMQRHSLEWLHRLAFEPRRLSGRYARTNAQFVACATSEIIRRRLLADKPA